MCCSNCGTENNNDEKYCTNCGKKLKKKKAGLIIAIVTSIVIISAFVILLIIILNRPTDEQIMQEGLNDYFSMNRQIKEIIGELEDTDGYISNGNRNDAIMAVGEYSQKLLSEGKIEEYDITEGQSVWIKFSSGIEYVYIPKEKDTDSTAVSTYQPCLSMYDIAVQDRGKKAVDGSAENIERIIEDYSFDNNYDNDDITLDVLRSIHANKVVIWHGHGGYSNKTHSFLELGLKLDEEKFLYDPIYYVQNLGYTGEYLSGELLFTSDGNIGVGHKFFENNLGSIDGSIIYLGACSSGVDDVLANTFLNKGASSVVGNSGIICTEYNLKSIQTVFSQMLNKAVSDNHYDNLQAAVHYSLDKNGGVCCELHQSHPVIFGKKDFRLTENEAKKTLSSTYVAGQYLVNFENRIICAKSDGIFYKESIGSEEKKISNEKNVYSLLSDGETIYYPEGYDNGNLDQRNNHKKIYKTSILQNASKVLFESEGYVELIGYQDNCIYYLEQNQSNQYALMKFNTSDNSKSKLTKDWDGQIISPCILGNKLYAYLKSNDSNDGVFRAYDLSTDNHEDIYNGIVDYYIYHDGNCVAFDTYTISTNSSGYAKNNHFTYLIDKEGTVKKSQEIKIDCDFEYLTSDGKYGLYFSSMGSGKFDLYTIDLVTGEVYTSENDAGSCIGKNYFITNDLLHPEKIYFMYNLKLYDVNTKSAKKLSHDDFEINITKPMWIIDGYIVDWDLNTYKIYDSANEEATASANISSDDATKIALEKAGGDDQYSAFYEKTVQYEGQDYYLINIRWKVDDGNGQFHFSHIGYSIVSMDGKDVKNADYINDHVQVY